MLNKNQIFILILIILTGGYLLNYYPTVITSVISSLIITFIPGILILMILSSKKLYTLEYFLYSLGIGLLFLITGGLLANSILPFLGITKPLSQIPLLATIYSLIFFVYILAYRRFNAQKIVIRIPKLNSLSIIFLLISFLFPILTILGSNLLNNGGSNILTLTSLLGIVVYVILIVLFHKWMHTNIYPFVIFSLTVALIFMGSLRGYYISSADAAGEYAITNFTLNSGIWHPQAINSSYNGMLSITILPIVYHFLCNTSLLSNLKVVYPLLFSFVPVILYALYKKIINDISAFVCTLFFAFQPTITAWTLFPTRQEIAFIFLSLSLLILLTENISLNLRKFLIVSFTFALVVTHYSTFYIALVTYLLTFVVFIFLKVSEKRFKWSMKSSEKFIISGKLLILIILFGLFWNFFMTKTGTGAVTFLHKSTSNFHNMLNNKAYSLGNSPLEYINISSNRKNTQYNPLDDLSSYVKSLENNKDIVISDYLNSTYPPTLASTSALPTTRNYLKYYNVSEELKKILLLLGVVFITLGFIKYIKSNKEVNKLLVILSFVTFTVFIGLVMMPYASEFYNPQRGFQQVLLLLSVYSLGGILFLLRSRFKLSLAIFTLFICCYMVLFTHAQYYFIGGNEVQLRFANVGKDYDLYYVTANEVSAASWLFSHKDDSAVVADNYSNFKLDQAPDYNFNTTYKIYILPESIYKEDYIYANRANTMTGITYAYFGRGLLIYNFQTQYVNDYKNLIYSNGKSAIYK